MKEKILQMTMTVSLLSFQVFSQSGKFNKIQKFIDQATEGYLAGVSVYVKSPKLGTWIGTSGYANLEEKEALQPKHIFSLASIGKMYNAVATLKLVEVGKLNLDDKITKYLSQEITSNLANGDQITIRHLLGHTSGLVNYDRDPELNKLYINGLLKLDTLDHLEALERYVYDKPARNQPGEEYHYSSTNYMLLAMIMDEVVPEGHTEYLKNKVLAKYGYHQTFFRHTPTQQFTNHYGDLDQDKQIENLTAQVIETTNWFIGDDGVYAPIEEAARFLENLMKGKMLKAETLTEMMTWNDPKRPDYGLGLMADKGFPYQFLIGHSGRGIGATMDLFYFPNQDMTVAIFCNTGIRGSAPECRKAYFKMRSKIVKKLFLF